MKNLKTEKYQTWKASDPQAISIFLMAKKKFQPLKISNPTLTFRTSAVEALSPHPHSPCNKSPPHSKMYLAKRYTTTIS